MRITIGEIRRIVAGVLREQTWMPGRYYPGAEPVSGRDRDRLNQPLGEDDGLDELDDLEEVDTDPSNNPGRPSDAYDFLGMHPKPEAALAHPAASGGGGGAAAPAGGSPSSEEE